MTPLAAVADVAVRLGRALTVAEDALADPGLLAEASLLVLTHMKYPEDYYDALAVPTAVAIVTSRAVERVLTRNAQGLTTGAEETTQTAGIFAQTAKYPSGSTSGGPWLTRADRAMLDNVTGANRAYAIDTAPTSAWSDLTDEQALQYLLHGDDAWTAA